MIVNRGDVFFADLSPVVGSEQGGIRPVLIIQNDIGNRFSPTVIVEAITAQIQKNMVQQPEEDQNSIKMEFDYFIGNEKASMQNESDFVYFCLKKGETHIGEIPISNLLKGEQNV